MQVPLSDKPEFLKKPFYLSAKTRYVCHYSKPPQSNFEFGIVSERRPREEIKSSNRISAIDH